MNIKTKLISILIAAAVIAGAMSVPEMSASAQGDIPQFQAITFYGDVEITGGADPDGFELVAKIGDWESDPVTIGTLVDDRYDGLLVHAPAELIGQDIVFWIEDQFQADETTPFAFINSTGTIKFEWSLPQLRRQNLQFSDVPVPTFTPTPIPPTATPIPIILEPTFYEGRVRAGSVPPPDGTLIHAVIDGYVTEFAVVLGGEFFLTFDPIDEIYDGQSIEFYIGNTKALQTDIFEDGIRKENFLLVFPPLPTPTPVPPTPTLTPTPTPTLTPTPTPEPTRTPTPTPTPTVVPSATPTPTPIADTTATAEAEATAEAIVKDEESGSCSAREGGPAGLGNIALLLAPLALLAWRRMERNAR
jgi:hypothetical protein